MFINKAPAKKSAQSTTLPAPTGGVDVRYPLAAMKQGTCVYAYNITPDAYGMAIRPGYIEHVTKVPTTGISNVKISISGIKSIITSTGATSVPSISKKIFAVTNIGIYDVTSSGQAPIEKLRFDVNDNESGHGVSCSYIDEGGHEFILYADERNGLFTYTKETDTWAKATGITGELVVERIAFVTIHKLRIWFVEKDTSDAWYMPVNAMMGEATKFSFGSKFPNGGQLRGLFTWSFDGGAGVDDYLVGISSSGDVIPYKGEDPSTADTWSLVGSYFIGGLPLGRRIATEAGGQLFILSSYGLISMNDLLTGVDTRDVSANGIASKISPMIRNHMNKSIYDLGWELLFLPSIGVYMVNSPKSSSFSQLQYVMNIATTGWCVWRGVPINCLAELEGKIYFASGNTVYRLYGNRDNVKLEQHVHDDMGTPIEFSLLTSFSTLDAPAAFKRVQFIRPDFLSVHSPEYGVKAIYDYKLDEVVMSNVTNPIDFTDSLWDVGKWDEALWIRSETSGTNIISGTNGIGRSVAIALKGTSTEETKLISMDVIWLSGGEL